MYAKQLNSSVTTKKVKFEGKQDAPKCEDNLNFIAGLNHTAGIEESFLYLQCTHLCKILRKFIFTEKIFFSLNNCSVYSFGISSDSLIDFPTLKFFWDQVNLYFF